MKNKSSICVFKLLTNIQFPSNLHAMLVNSKNWTLKCFQKKRFDITQNNNHVIVWEQLKMTSDINVFLCSKKQNQAKPHLNILYKIKCILLPWTAGEKDNWLTVSIQGILLIFLSNCVPTGEILAWRQSERIGQGHAQGHKGPSEVPVEQLYWEKHEAYSPFRFNREVLHISSTIKETDETQKKSLSPLHVMLDMFCSRQQYKIFYWWIVLTLNSECKSV